MVGITRTVARREAAAAFYMEAKQLYLQLQASFPRTDFSYEMSGVRASLDKVMGVAPQRRRNDDGGWHHVRR